MRMMTSSNKTLSLAVLTQLIPLIFVFIAFLISCGSGGSGSPSYSTETTGTVKTYITDPPVCKVPNGTLQHVWVTITRVRAHLSSSVDPNDKGWVDLVDLRDNPKQIDLLSLDATQGLLTQLGSATGIPAGKYQQIRMYLLSNTPSAAEEIPDLNECRSFGYNCVVEEDQFHTLELSSQAQTGIKIPPGQLTGGGLTVRPGQVVDFNLDFDACSSIVRQGNGQYRLKPTLHAGEISLVDSLIRGRVVDETTNDPIPNAIVLIEKKDADEPIIDRVFAQKITDSEGRFIFGPLPAGPYDVVVAARTASKTYNATVTLAVPLGSYMGDIPLVPEIGEPATIKGVVTTEDSSGNPAAADVEVVALQAVSGTLIVTIPLFEGSTPLVAPTASSGSCPFGTACLNYIRVVPASNPQVGTFSTPTTSYAPPLSGRVVFYISARAFEVGTNDPFFNLQSEITAVSVTAGSTSTAPVIVISGTP